MTPPSPVLPGPRRLRWPLWPLSPTVADLVVAAVVAVLTGADAAVNDPAYRQADWLTWLLFGVSVAALLVRSRWPVAVSVITGAACAGWALYGHIGELLNLPVMAALYALAVRGDRRRTLRAAAVAAVASGAVSVVAGIDVAQPQGAPLLEMLWPLVPLLLGEVVRGRGELLQEYADRAVRAEAEREQESRRKVHQERVRIARELHDVVAHTVSAMTVQAGLALDALDKRPDVAREAMRQVRASGKEAVRELRATVGVLRDGRQPERGPAPRLERLEELVERVRGAGLKVSLHVDTGRREVPQMVELAAYRIVQEALTNVIKHAGARHAAVSVVLAADRPDGDALVVETTDDGPPAQAAAGEGYGLIGVRERATAAGGSAEAGPVPGGGWRVRAVLPLEAP
ncbi:sensor histidine kinase [Streptomyces flavofungini]|uniref:sensor histidine kinase n=1 Tax=Streptomyces flavofungini TaxID=68200 RepID=UPI0025B19520|nr:sensor histidine kinase [Streptomyces flavofungini]WJV50757.1 sensor histidine kinase [Streptomyces flavofungini]